MQSAADIRRSSVCQSPRAEANEHGEDHDFADGRSLAATGARANERKRITSGGRDR